MPASNAAALESYLLDPVAEAMPRDELRRVQGDRLAECVARGWRAGGFWRDRLAGAGVRPEDIRATGDLARLPFTTKADLRATYPLGSVVVPRHELARALTSSGTTGTPTVAAYTRGDLELWAELVARGLAAAAVRAGSTVHVAFGYGLFTGGPGFQAAAERLGALVIPAGVGDEPRQLRLLRDFEAQALLCTPTYALTLLEAARHEGVDPRDLPVSAGVHGGEPAGPRLRGVLEAGWGTRTFEAYGLSEIIGPGVAHGCAAGALHVNEDHFLPEVIDPASGRVLADGELGELVLTGLTREAVPLLRYRTGDLSRLLPAEVPCACGRTLVRMESVRGRLADLLSVGGRRFLPLDVEELVVADPELAHLCQIVVGPEGPSVRVETSSARAIDDVARLAETVAARIAAALGVSLPVQVLPPGTLPRSRGKAPRVVAR